MVNSQTAPPEFNNPDWQLHKGNKNHVHFLNKCIELFWLIWECQQLTGEAFFGQEWLAEKMGITVRHVQNLIAELRSKNLIEVDRRDQNYYRITEFFSKSPGEWTELAKAKAKAAIAKFYPNRTSQKASTENQASKPKRESSFKAAKIQTATPQAPSQPSPEERAAIEKFAQEEMARINAEFEAKYEAEKQTVTPELKQDLEEVAEQVAKEYYKKTKPSPSEFNNKLIAKLKEYGIEAPGWLVGNISLEWPEKRRHYFR